MPPFWDWIKINPIELINDFGEFLEKQILLKEKIVKDLKKSESTTKETLEFYKGQLIELKNINRSFELRKLGDSIN